MRNTSPGRIDYGCPFCSRLPRECRCADEWDFWGSGQASLDTSVVNFTTTNLIAHIPARAQRASVGSLFRSRLSP